MTPATINRYALVLEPSEAYLEWAKEFPDPDPDLTLANLKTEGGTIYLIPNTNDNPEAWLKRNFKKLFEEELYAWCTAEDLWPAERTYKVFRQFFNFSFHSMIFDMVGRALEREEV